MSFFVLPKAKSPCTLSRLMLAALAACAAPVSAQTVAQAQPTSGQAAGQSVAELPSVLVQARRAAEMAKDVPFTVNVIGGDELEQRRLGNLEDILRSTPGVDVNSWGGVNSANVRIRGVGSLYQSGMDDASVIANIDGVSTSVSNTGLGTLDIEQVEVLKGPQGTLFGRNSAAGAINIRTRKPTRHFEASLRGEVGSKHHHLAEGIISGPLSETVSARLALRRSGQDNQVHNRLTGKPVSRPHDWTWRAGLLWQPQASTHVLLRAGQHNSRKYQNAMVLRPYGSRPQQELSTADPLAGNYYKIGQYSLEAQHDLPWARLTSLTSYEHLDGKAQNASGREVNQIWYGMDKDSLQRLSDWNKSWSQDLRLSSLPGSRVFWVAGANVYRSKRGNTRDAVSLVAEHEFTHDADAVYGEATWPLGKAFKLTTGLRHTREEKTYAATYRTAGTSTPDARSLSERHTTGRLGLGWEMTPQTNLYAVFAKGHKAGGFTDFAISANDSRPYKAGDVKSAELGFKHESEGGGLRLAGAVFFNKVRNDHLLAFDPVTFSSWTVNVDTESKGAELEAIWRASEGLTFSGGLNYTDGKILTPAVTNVPAGNVRAGSRVPDVPRFSFSLAMAYQRKLPSFWGLRSPVLNTRLSLRHVGKRPADPQNNFDLGSYQKVDLRAGISSGNTEVYLWGDNLLNKRYDLYGYYVNPTHSIGMPALGRRFGIGVAHYF